jgi:hypothetical protein
MVSSPVNSRTKSFFASLAEINEQLAAMGQMPWYTVARRYDGLFKTERCVSP